MAIRKGIKRLSFWVVSVLALMASVSAVSYFLDEGSAAAHKNRNPDFIFNAEDTKITEVEWDTDANLLHVCWQSQYTRNNEKKGHDGCMEVDKDLSLGEQRRLVYQAAQAAFEADKGVEKVVVVYKTHPLLDTPNTAFNTIRSISKGVGNVITGTADESYEQENTRLSLKVAEWKRESDALRSEIDALKAEVAGMKASLNNQTVAGQQQQALERQPADQPQEKPTRETPSEPETPAEEPGISITGATVWRFFSTIF